jgi:hypothetical protein
MSALPKPITVIITQLAVNSTTNSYEVELISTNFPTSSKDGFFCVIDTQNCVHRFPLIGIYKVEERPDGS